MPGPPRKTAALQFRVGIGLLEDFRQLLRHKGVLGVKLSGLLKKMITPMGPLFSYLTVF